MKKIVKNVMPAVYMLFIAFSAASCNQTQAAPAAASASAPAGQPVDLTYAAEKSLPSVVYIKSVINAKTQTVEYSDPFDDFFLIPSEVSSDADRVTTMASASARYRLRSVQLPVQVSSSQLMVIS